MEKQFMTFKVKEGHFGINILGIKEINYSTVYTPVPLSRQHIVGLLNLRGQIVTVVDTGIPLGYENSNTENKDSSLLIIKTNNELSPIARKHGIETHLDQVGLLVDQIGDVISCDESEVEPVPAHADVSVSKFLEGVVKREDTLVALINVAELLKYEGE